jgi:hypothetical protein
LYPSKSQNRQWFSPMHPKTVPKKPAHTAFRKITGYCIRSGETTGAFHAGANAPGNAHRSPALTAFPFVAEVVSILLNVLRINEDFILVFISSCGYGLAGGLLVSRQIAHRVIGLSLIGILILAGFYSILMAIGTGCGA